MKITKEQVSDISLTVDTTINLNNTMTAADIQALIDAQPKNLSGYSLTFQFADGTYTLSSTLTFEHFYGGTMLILGNAINNTLSATKAVILNFTTSWMVCSNIRATLYIRYLNIYNIDTANNTCLTISRSLSSVVDFNYFHASSNAGVEGLRAIGCTVESSGNMFGLLLRGASSFWGTIRSVTVGDNGVVDRPGTGLFANSGIVAKYGTQPVGSIANEGLFAGGIIR